jgi:hypothetical protein
VVPVTTIALTSDESGELAHVVFVGTADDYQFEVDELFDHLDVIESYRLGDPFPEVGSAARATAAQISHVVNMPLLRRSPTPKGHRSRPAIDNNLI